MTGVEEFLNQVNTKLVPLDKDFIRFEWNGIDYKWKAFKNILLAFHKQDMENKGEKFNG